MFILHLSLSSSPQGHFMYVSNLHEYGRLIKPDNFETHHLHNDIFNIFENRLVSECYNVLMYALFV